jgi:hypothetical protein
LFNRSSRGRGDDVVIDLRDSVARLGFPGRCPACGGGGYLDAIDVSRRLQHEHCQRCGHAWTLSFEELVLDR